MEQTQTRDHLQTRRIRPVRIRTLDEHTRRTQHCRERRMRGAVARGLIFLGIVAAILALGFLEATIGGHP